MSKYGLQLRVKPSNQKKPPRPPPPTAPGFRDDDDDDVEQEISRQATKNKSLKDVEEQHKKALEEDPSVFDYDGVYDDMKQKIARPKAQDREERRPKYIQKLMEKAQQRQREQEIVYERKLAKERSKDDHLYADKEKFVTGAYKKKLAEQEKWMKEEHLRQLREEKEDVTKKSDLSDFYFNLGKNVAFGAKDVELRKQDRKPMEQTESMKPEKKGDGWSPDALLGRQSLADSRSASEFSQVKEEGDLGQTSPVSKGSESEMKSVSDKTVPITSSVQEKTTIELPPEAQPKPDHHKRSQDAVAAAKERFLARKKAKEQAYI